MGAELDSVVGSEHADLVDSCSDVLCRIGEDLGLEGKEVRADVLRENSLECFGSVVVI